jgi:hypothetical protein
LSELDLSSTDKLADRIINQHKNNNNEKDLSECRKQILQAIDDDYDPLSTTTYQHILKCICAFRKCLEDSDDSHLEKFMGYLILEKRASPLTFDWPGTIVTYHHHALRLIADANVVNRQSIKRKMTQKRKVSEPEEIQLDIDDSDHSTNVVPVPKRRKTDSPVKIKMEPRRYKKRYTCCACKITSVLDKTTTFRLVPRITHLKKRYRQ